MNYDLSVVTCSLGVCDIPLDVSSFSQRHPSIYFHCVTDTPSSFQSVGWNCSYPDQSMKYLQSINLRLASRVPKVFPLFFIPNSRLTRYVLWVDSNVHLHDSFFVEILGYLNGPSSIPSFSTLPHKKRKSLLSEILYNTAFGKITLSQLLQSIFIFRSFLLTPSLRWNGVILYDFIDPSIYKFQRLWFHYISNTVIRDQISITKCLHDSSVASGFLDRKYYNLMTIVPHQFYLKHQTGILSSMISFVFTSVHRILSIFRSV